MSFWGAREEMDRMTGDCAAKTPRLLLRSAEKSNKQEDPVRFTGTTLLIQTGAGHLEISLLLSSVATARKGKKSLISILEALSPQRKGPESDRCWMFIVDNNVNEKDDNLNSVVATLLGAGAVLSDKLAASKLQQISNGTRADVFCSPVIPFVSLKEARAGTSHMPNAAALKHAIGKEYSHSESAGSMSALLRHQPSDPLSETSQKSQDEPAEQENKSESPQDGDTGEATSSELWCMKIFLNAPGMFAGSSPMQSPLMIPEAGGSNFSHHLDDCFPEEETARELRILHKLQPHNHVLKLHGLVQILHPVSIATSWALLTEYCSGGSMLVHLKSAGKQSEPDAKHLMFQLVSAMDHMHQREVIHRDVKLDHIYLRSEKTDLVLGGFGSACRLSDAKRRYSEAGTLGYTPPEVIQRNLWSEAADMFSVGVVFYIVVSCTKPFGGSRPPELTKHSTISKPIDFSARKAFVEVSAEYKDIVSRLLEKTPDLRPSAHSAKRAKWFGNLAAEEERRVTMSALSDESEHSHAPSEVVADPKRAASPAPGGMLFQASSPASRPAVGSGSSSSRSRNRSYAPGGRDASPERQLQQTGRAQAEIRSRSWAERVQYRTRRILPSLPLPFGRSSARDREERTAFTNVSPDAQDGQQQTAGEAQGRGQSSNRALSMFWSMLPSRRE